MSETRTHEPESKKLDIQEKGANGQTGDKRLYLQLQVFTGAKDIQKLVKALESKGIESVLYADVNDPTGVGLLLMAENPDFFVNEARKFLLEEPFASLTRRPEMTMIGRTYSSGREQDLEDWLLKRSRRYALNKEWPWAVWYPLRRKPEFELLPREEQGKILMEHAVMGRAFGEAGLAFDIRLACYGLDQNDNEFVLGLLSSELYPLSRLVQEMRKSQQTAKYIQNLGPFFVGKAVWQSKLKV